MTLLPLPPQSTSMPVADWLSRLASGVRNPPANRDDFRARSAAIQLACHNVPARLWCQQSLILALQKFQFWPSAADVCELLGEFEISTRPLAQQLGVTPAPAVERLAAPAEIGDLLSPWREAEREHVRTEARRFAADMAAQAPRRRAVRPDAPGHLDPLRLALGASEAVLRTRPDLARLKLEYEQEFGN